MNPVCDTYKKNNTEEKQMAHSNSVKEEMKDLFHSSNAVPIKDITKRKKHPNVIFVTQEQYEEARKNGNFITISEDRLWKE